MANVSAFQAGWATGTNLAAEQRARKQQLSDEERQSRVTELYNQGHSLSKLIPSMTGEHRDKAMGQLTDIEQQIASIYHPDNNPGALQKDWHMLAGLIHKSHGPALANITSYDPARTQDTSFTPDEQSITLPATDDYVGQARTMERGTPASSPIALPSAPITIPGTRVDVRPAASIMTPQQRRTMTQRDAARKAAELDVASAGLTPTEEAQADSAKKLATVRAAQKNYETLNPNATSEQKASFLADVVQQAYGITQKPALKLYTLPDGSKSWLDASRPDLIPAGSTAVAPGVAKVGLKYDTATGQVSDIATGKRYNPGDPGNPPEVAAMFQNADTFTKKKQQFQEQLVRDRGVAMGAAREMQPLSVLDTTSGNAPTYATYQEMLHYPGRFLPATSGAKALAQENLMGDLDRVSKGTRRAIVNLKEDFPEDMQVKIAVAMQASDPGSAVDQLIASGALGTLSSDQWDFLVATRQLAENAMSMRSILGAGQGSEDVRDAIRDTLPSLLSPDKEKALAQLDAYDQTIKALHRGVPKVPLRTDTGYTDDAGTTGTTVKMKAPNGSIKDVPADQVEHWKSKGAVVVKEQP